MRWNRLNLHKNQFISAVNRKRGRNKTDRFKCRTFQLMNYIYYPTGSFRGFNFQNNSSPFFIFFCKFPFFVVVVVLVPDMPQFGLSTANSHWGYSAAGAYSPYFTPSSLGSCGAPTTTQFNTPALGFSGATPDQTSTQDTFGSSSAVTSRESFSTKSP